MRKIALQIVTLIIFASFSHAATLADIRNDVRYTILDTTATTNNLRYSDAFLNYRINQTAREIAQMVYPVYSVRYITPVANQAEYTVSTDTLKIDKVSFNIGGGTNSYRKLDYSTAVNLDQSRGILWQNLPASQPLNYYVKGNKIVLVPAPSSSLIYTNGIQIFCYTMPSDMVNDTDQPWDGQYNLNSYHNFVTIGTVIKCKKDKGQDWTLDQTLLSGMIGRMQTDAHSSPDNNTVITVTK